MLMVAVDIQYSYRCYPCLLVFTLVYLYLPVCTHAPACLPVLTPVYPWLLVFACVYPCLTVFTHVHLYLPIVFTQCLPIFTSNYLCLLMFTLVYSCLPTFIHIYPCLYCLPVFTYVYQYLPIISSVNKMFLNTLSYIMPYLWFGIKEQKKQLKICERRVYLQIYQCTLIPNSVHTTSLNKCLLVYLQV